jgi:ABC-type sugar transport system substrate-binding protein
MRKFIICVLILGVALFGFATGKSESQKTTYGYVMYQAVDVWNSYTMKGFKFAAQQKGVDVIVLDPEGNNEKSLSSVEDLITKKVTAVDYYPITPELAQSVIQKLNKAKIPVVI